MKLRSFLLITIAFLFSINNAHAVLINSEPPSTHIITTSNGYEWVYAAPVSPDWTGTRSYLPQELYGFTVATAQDFLTSFVDLEDLIAQFAISSSTIYSSSSTCSASYFTETDFCNGSDVHRGYIWQNPWDIVRAGNHASETFMVRSDGSVPVPAPLALLGLGLAAIGFASRKRKA